jgi:hypothetical protein
MDAYATHVPVLDAIFKFRNIDTVLEFGMGNNSTPFLVKKCQSSVISIEMQQTVWYETMVSQDLFNNKKWSPILCLGPHAIFENKDIMNRSYDLVFVDGHGDSRPECINHFFGKSNIIVAHDVEAECYRWNLVNLPEDYRKFYYSKLDPATAVYSNDLELISFLEKSLNMSNE